MGEFRSSIHQSTQFRLQQEARDQLRAPLIQLADQDLGPGLFHQQLCGAARRAIATESAQAL
ncbi:hypothetical protein [Brachybacterium muris]|uniref:Uncharacterized protein n=1 Tax=Brachybacterium muris UCD-AY4 TaxID=1249481 RepID=A0A022KTB1_9MICO|nr:hypothetical protein [Brachybacterium muris]EYT49040.1 hypothetical protein D641_0110280 [Brachybacterium muris UCD-AY4]MCT2176424.1 hypothetical protein [Brachybacterium muris]